MSVQAAAFRSAPARATRYCHLTMVGSDGSIQPSAIWKSLVACLYDLVAARLWGSPGRVGSAIWLESSDAGL